MIRKKTFIIFIVLCVLVMPLAGIAQGSILNQLDQAEIVVERLSKLSTTEVEALISVFQSNATNGYSAMFTQDEKDNLNAAGVTPTTIVNALEDLKTQYTTQFPTTITTALSDVYKLAVILTDIRKNHFTTFRSLAKTEGELELDIFVDILLTVGTLELDELNIPESVSTDWVNALITGSPNQIKATTFLSDHGVRLSNLNAFFGALNTTDNSFVMEKFKKMGVIITPTSSGGGGGGAPAQTYTITVDETLTISQINDPAITEIVITMPSTIALDRIINIPSNIVTSAFAAEKPFVLNYGDISFTLPQGFIPSDTLAGTTAISLTVSRINDLPVSAGMTNSGDVFQLTLTVNTGDQQTTVTSFAVPVTVTIPADDLSLTTTEMEKLGLYRYSGNQWTYIGGTTNKQTKELSATLNSFSQYRVMIYNKTFTDISTHWAKRTIELLASRHLVAGMTATTFAPESSLTRAQTATFLVRALNLKPTSSSISFSDVKSGAWYYSTVHTAAQAGLISGYPDGTFKPNQVVSRQEFASMVVRAARAANQAEALTAAEINQILAAYGDTNSISVWARTDMAHAIHMGLIGGFPDNTIQPVGISTRAQGTVITERLLRALNLI